MLSGFELLILALAVAALLYSGAWADRTYRRFDKIPAHYSFRGEATRLTARRGMVWSIPIMFSVILVAFAAMLMLIPVEYLGGDPKAAFWVMLLAFPAAQGFLMWLLARWAAKQA